MKNPIRLNSGGKILVIDRRFRPERIANLDYLITYDQFLIDESNNRVDQDRNYKRYAHNIESDPYSYNRYFIFHVSLPATVPFSDPPNFTFAPQNSYKSYLDNNLNVRSSIYHKSL